MSKFWDFKHYLVTIVFPWLYYATKYRCFKPTNKEWTWRLLFSFRVLHQYQGEDVSMAIWLSAILPNYLDDKMWICDEKCDQNMLASAEHSVDEIKQLWINWKECGNPCECSAQSQIKWNKAGLPSEFSLRWKSLDIPNMSLHWQSIWGKYNYQQVLCAGCFMECHDILLSIAMSNLLHSVIQNKYRKLLNVGNMCCIIFILFSCICM